MRLGAFWQRLLSAARMLSGDERGALGARRSRQAVLAFLVAALLVPLAVALSFAQTTPTTPPPAAPVAQTAAAPKDDPGRATRYAGLDDRSAWRMAKDVLPLDLARPLDVTLPAANARAAGQG